MRTTIYKLKFVEMGRSSVSMAEAKALGLLPGCQAEAGAEGAEMQRARHEIQAKTAAKNIAKTP